MLQHPRFRVNLSSGNVIYAGLVVPVVVQVVEVPLLQESPPPPLHALDALPKGRLLGAPRVHYLGGLRCENAVFAAKMHIFNCENTFFSNFPKGANERDETKRFIHSPI